MDFRDDLGGSGGLGLLSWDALGPLELDEIVKLVLLDRIMNRNLRSFDESVVFRADMKSRQQVPHSDLEANS